MKIPMRWLLFLSRLAFICEIFFLLSVSGAVNAGMDMGRKPEINDHHYRLFYGDDHYSCSEPLLPAGVYC